MRKRILWALPSMAATITASLLAGGAASAQATQTTGTIITVANTPFGKALVVGSGKYKGYSLYDITSDSPPSYGCTTVTVTTEGHTGTCAGPSNDSTAEWPAITTTGAPAAGRGVNASLLGTVYRPKVGTQITYAGHPLYLFDNAAHQFTGEGWDEPSLPPWHGIWNLVKPNGSQLPWTSNLTTVTLHGHKYLATPMESGAGLFNFPVYTVRSNERTFPAVLTAGFPAASHGVHASRVGIRWTSLGEVATYKGHPLSLYSSEGLNPATRTAVGNGNKVDGAALVSP